MVDERFDVSAVGLDAVVHLRRPLAVTVTTEVEGQAPIVLPQREADEVPRVRGEPAAVEEQQRLLAGRPPVEIAETHAPQHDLMLVGDDELPGREAGDLGGVVQVLEIIRRREKWGSHVRPPSRRRRPAARRP